jgi:hypothetical protein
MKEIEVGVVKDYFARIGVAAMDITAAGVKIGDHLRIKGHTTDFNMVVESLQVEHAQVGEVGAGASVGTKVPDRVRAGDAVFKVVED